MLHPATDKAVKYVQSKLPKDFKPQVAMILGSGLSVLAKKMSVVADIHYDEIPEFFSSTVKGHAGRMLCGHIGDKAVVCMQGRVHLYEGASLDDIRLFISTLNQLGAKQLIVTNAAGSLIETNGPGSLVCISDHINFTGQNILIGPNDDSVGPRFLPMETVYNPGLRQKLHETAKSMGMSLPEAIYIGVLGPSYETPAEIRTFKQWGAGLIGMSTVQEVIYAHYLGMQVVGVSLVSNHAAGLSETAVSHEEVLHFAKLAGEQLAALVAAFVEKI